MEKPTWKRFWIVLAVFAANYGLDRITKILAQGHLRGHEARVYLDGLMVLVYTENDGAFLGMGSGWPYILKLAIFIAIPLAVCAFGLWYAVAREAGSGRAAIIATIVAGGIGNIQDRLLNGFNVVDFLNFGIGRLRTGILNVGDMSVTFGVIALAIAVSRAERSATAPMGSGKKGSKGKKS